MRRRKPARTSVMAWDGRYGCGGHGGASCVIVPVRNASLAAIRGHRQSGNRDYMDAQH
jgi:hypothetical protein